MEEKIEKQYPVIINGKYYNKEKDDISGTLADTIFHYACNLFDKKYKKNISSRSLALPYKIALQNILKIITEQFEEITIFPLGHATCLITYKNIKILLDPIIYKSSFFFSRFTESIPRNIVKDIDFIIYSHNHPDHYNRIDYNFIAQNSIHPIVFVPENMNRELPHNKNTEIIAMSWWQEKKINRKGIDISICCLPAVHWSQSTVWNRNENLWCSWSITIKNKSIFFSGDTAYGQHFKSISHFYKTIDVAIITIAPYLPINIQKESHLNPKEAWLAFCDLKKPIIIPIHWGTFAYGEEGIKEPIQETINIFNQNQDLERLKCTTMHTYYILKDRPKKVILKK